MALYFILLSNILLLVKSLCHELQIFFLIIISSIEWICIICIINFIYDYINYLFYESNSNWIAVLKDFSIKIIKKYTLIEKERINIEICICYWIEFIWFNNSRRLISTKSILFYMIIFSRNDSFFSLLKKNCR